MTTWRSFPKAMKEGGIMVVYKDIFVGHSVVKSLFARQKV